MRPPSRVHLRNDSPLTGLNYRPIDRVSTARTHVESCELIRTNQSSIAPRITPLVFRIAVRQLVPSGEECRTHRLILTTGMILLSIKSLTVLTGV